MLYPYSSNLDRRVSAIVTFVTLNFRQFLLKLVLFMRLTGSFEHSPRFIEQFQAYLSTEDLAIIPAETQLREDLADAMRESPRDSGEHFKYTYYIARDLMFGFGFCQCSLKVLCKMSFKS